MLNQTSIQYKSVEDHLVHLEDCLKKYQEEMKAQEDTVKSLNSELNLKSQENVILTEVSSVCKGLEVVNLIVYIHLNHLF